MPNLGMGELVIILLILLLVFGAGRLPQIGEGLGKAIKGLKRGLHSDEHIELEEQRRPIKSANPSLPVETTSAAPASSSQGEHAAEPVSKKPLP